MTTNAERRHERKCLLENIWEQQKADGVPEDTILATFANRTRVSMAKAREYLKEIKASRPLQQEIPLA